MVLLNHLAKDTNGDGIWDTTAVLVGMISSNQINETKVWSDYKEFFHILMLLLMKITGLLNIA